MLASSEVGRDEFRCALVNIYSLNPFVWGNLVGFDVCEQHVGAMLGNL